MGIDHVDYPFPDSNSVCVINFVDIPEQVSGLNGKHSRFLFDTPPVLHIRKHLTFLKIFSKFRLLCSYNIHGDQVVTSINLAFSIVTI